MMSYTLSLSDDGKYILLKVIGDITRNSAMQHNLEAHKMGEELGVNTYLVDLTEARNVESVISNYEFAYTDMTQTPDIDRYARVVVLVDPHDHSHDFIETVARNTGLDVTLYRDRDQAVQHLLEN